MEGCRGVQTEKLSGLEFKEQINRTRFLHTVKQWQTVPAFTRILRYEQTISASVELRWSKHTFLLWFAQINRTKPNERSGGEVINGANCDPNLVFHKALINGVTACGARGRGCGERLCAACFWKHFCTLLEVGQSRLVCFAINSLLSAIGLCLQQQQHHPVIQCLVNTRTEFSTVNWSRSTFGC